MKVLLLLALIFLFSIANDRSYAQEWPNFQGKAGIQVARPSDPDVDGYERAYSHLAVDGVIPFRVGRSRREIVYNLGLRLWVTRQPHLSSEMGEDATTETNNEILLEKASVDYTRRRWRFRIGQQELALGEVLGPSVIDLANARDYRQADQFLKSTDRVPQAMALVEYKRRRYGWQLFLSPLPKTMLLPKFLAETPIISDFPDKQPEYGFRYNYFYKGLDLKFYGIHHQNRSPIFSPELGPSGPILRAMQRYEDSLAGTFNYAWDYTVLRGELIHTKARREKVGDLSAKVIDQAVLALDYTSESQWLLVGQVQAILPKQCTALPSCSEQQLWGGAQVQKPWFDSVLRTNFFLYGRVDQRTLYQKVELEWDTGSNVQVRVSHESYDGFTQDGLGFLDMQDRSIFDVYIVF